MSARLSNNRIKRECIGCSKAQGVLALENTPYSRPRFEFTNDNKET
jgi:hypothetical protein